MDGLSRDDLTNAKSLIDELNLTPVIERLVRIENWSKNEALEACQQYKRYLFLKRKYGAQYELPPSLDIDSVWHAHILHTKDYASFSQIAFGYFLHHHPHQATASSMSQLKEMFENQTRRLYWEEYGEELYAIRSTTVLLKLIKLCKDLVNYFKTKKGYHYQEHDRIK